MSALMGGMRLLPYRARIRFGGWAMAHLIAPVAGWRRRVRDNLALVWPDLPAAEGRRLVAEVCDNVGRTLAELYSPQEFKAQVKDSPIRGDGLETILQARARGQGVILVSGHFGNHDIARAVLAGRGLDVGAFYKPQRNPFFERHFRQTIGAISEPVFPRGRKGLADLVRHLRAGGMLGILIDQHQNSGARLRFLGKPARTATSAAELALKYDCLLVPVYGVRQPDGLSFELLVEAPIAPGTPEAMTQAINDSLEAQVRAHPGQWFWVHRALEIDGPARTMRPKMRPNDGPGTSGRCGAISARPRRRWARGLRIAGSPPRVRRPARCRDVERALARPDPQHFPLGDDVVVVQRLAGVFAIADRHRLLTGGTDQLHPDGPGQLAFTMPRIATLSPSPGQRQRNRLGSASGDGCRFRPARGWFRRSVRCR